MKNYIKTYILLILALAIATSCVYQYEIKVKPYPRLLVIEGDILVGSESKFALSYTIDVNTESIIRSVEGDVSVECEDGTIYKGKPVESVDSSYLSFKKIVYVVDMEKADSNKRYRLNVHINGYGSTSSTYQTDFLKVRNTPPIDSIYYTFNPDKTAISIKLDTHYSQEDAAFFKWTYHEDWEVRAHLLTTFFFDTVGDSIASFSNFGLQNKYYCWQSHSSTDILIANTEKLASNVVSGMKIRDIYSIDNRISALYAIEVCQEMISEESYKYWRTMQQNNDGLGGIFSPQPNEMPGNIISVDHPEELVIGYVDATVPQKKRIFISSLDLEMYDKQGHNCWPSDIYNINSDPRIAYSAGLDVYFYIKDSICIWYDKRCLDCRYYGTKTKPSYWPGDYK